MNIHRIALAAFATTLCISPAAYAEDSEGETPIEEYELAQKTNPLPEAVKAYLAQLDDLDRRYPDSAEVDIDQFMAAEGESLALGYCGALGFKGACTIEEKDGAETFVGLDPKAVATGAEGKTKWWEWLLDHLFNVGVIPQANACPAPFKWTQIHMDDEDKNNENGRGGWIGAITSTKNTTYRFCKLDTITSLAYRPLPKEGNQHDYAVVNMGLLCPSGARRVLRIEENELWRNANSSSGDIFPNFKVYNTWFNFYCHFDGARKSILGHMSSFPKLGFAHGVFAAPDMPSTYVIQRGFVRQDDEDILNWNAWVFGSGDTVMRDDTGTSTWRNTAKVE